jgi:hypothetical protein
LGKNVHNQLTVVQLDIVNDTIEVIPIQPLTTTIIGIVPDSNNLTAKVIADNDDFIVHSEVFVFLRYHFFSLDTDRTTLEVESRLQMQLVHHETDRTIPTTTKNVVVRTNVEQRNRTIRFGMNGETSTISVQVQATGDS